MMKVSYNVKSTAETIPPIEVGVDTVYENLYVTKETVENEFEEPQEMWNIGIQKEYSHREYTEILMTTEKGQLLVAENMMDTLGTMSEIVTMVEIEQAKMLMEILTMVEAMQGGGAI